MGVFKRFISEFTENDDEDLKDYAEEEESEVSASTPAKSETVQPGPARSSVSMSSSALEMKVVKPETYEEVTSFGDFLLRRHTVVLNLEDTNKETIKRIIDFLTGGVFAINGNIRRVANSTYVVTPSGVNVSGEQMPDKNEKASPRELF